MNTVKTMSCLTLLGMVMTGCSAPTTYTQMKLQSNYISLSQNQNNPEIITTNSYQLLNKKNVVVAIKAPDQCTSYTTDQRTGDAQSSETILKTDCGFEMGEIERSLARIGYQVISWKAFNQKIETEKNLTKAAQDLGAEIIFQINSLENSVKNLGQDARWERSYYTSDYLGSSVAPLNMIEYERAALATKYLLPLESKRQDISYNVTIDAAAIQVANGQTIWYYRWAKASTPAVKDNNIAVYLHCIVGASPSVGCYSFTPTAEYKVGTFATGDTIGVSSTEKPADIAKAEYAKLYREVVTNLVDAFSNSKVY